MEEPTCKSEQVTPDPGFEGSELVTGSNKWLLFDMHVFGSEVVPGLQRLPAVMDTAEYVLPPIPHLAQTKVFDGESLCRFSLETVTWNLTL